MELEYVLGQTKAFTAYRCIVSGCVSSLSLEQLFLSG